MRRQVVIITPNAGESLEFHVQTLGTKPARREKLWEQAAAMPVGSVKLYGHPRQYAWWFSFQFPKTQGAQK